MVKPAPNLDAAAIEAIQSIPTGVGIFDVVGRSIQMRFLNDGYYQMIDSPRESRNHIFATSPLIAVHPDDQNGLLDEAIASIAQSRLFEFRFRVLTNAKQYLWLGIKATHKKIDDHTERFFASYYNVNDLVQTQKELQQHSEERDTILDSIPGGVAIFSSHDGEIRLDYTNPGFYALHHGSETYWKSQSKNPVDWLTPEDRILFEQEFADINSGKKKEGDVVYRIIGEDQKLHWVNNQFRPAYQENGVSYFYASFADLDSLKDAEEQMFQTRQMYEDATMTAKLIVWTYDPETKQVQMMQSGYTKEVCAQLGVPLLIKNIPESLLPYIEPEDREKFSNAYKAMDQGSAYAEAEFRFKNPLQTSIQYERMVLKGSSIKPRENHSSIAAGKISPPLKQAEERFI